MQHLYAKVTWRRDVADNIVYLTFDDGPIEDITPQVLDILKSYGVKATFFCVGENISKHSDVFERILKEGHAVGNHTYNHLEGIRTGYRDYMENIEKADRTLEQYGAESWLFRPPYGRMTQKQKRAISRTHEIVMWDVLTHDYNTKSYTPERILEIVKRYTRRGSIINFHDSKKSAKNVLVALPMVIEWLQGEGYKCERM